MKNFKLVGPSSPNIPPGYITSSKYWSFPVRHFAVACRGCWMPGDNVRSSWMSSNILYFLVVHQNLSNSPHKISDDLYSNLPKFFSNFSLFASVFKFQENSLLGCPPVPHHT